MQQQPANQNNVTNPVKRKQNFIQPSTLKKPKSQKSILYRNITWVEQSKPLPTLNEFDKQFEEYLVSKSINLKERYFICEDHIKYFNNLLSSNPQIKTILEIGFYYGHIADILLSIRPDIRVISIDNTATDTVTNFTKPTLDSKYPNRHLMLFGNSSTTLNTFNQFNPDLKVDMIFIDGSIYVQDVRDDILSCKSFAHKNTTIIVNSLKPFSKGGTGRYDAWNMMVKTGVIYETGYYNNEDITKTWGEGKFNLDGEMRPISELTMAETFWSTNKVYLWFLLFLDCFIMDLWREIEDCS